MTTKAEKDEARRQERIAGWRTDHFRFREDEAGNLYIAQSEWIGPETLTVNASNIKELTAELDKLTKSVEADGEGVEDLSDPAAAGYDPNAVPKDPQTTPQGTEKK